jgi:hypothetical protein
LTGRVKTVIAATKFNASVDFAGSTRFVPIPWPWLN